VDLGCGPGNSTRLLAERWPGASTVGVDNSAAILECARATYPDMTWIQGDLAHWYPPVPPDLIFANASFQWAPDHADLLAGLCAGLRPGGILAFQMPFIHQQPVAEIYRRLIISTKWRGFPSPDERLTVETPIFYYDALSKYCRPVEIWETVYHHLLENHEEMVTWYQSTGLRPFLATCRMIVPVRLLRPNWRTVIASSSRRSPTGESCFHFIGCLSWPPQSKAGAWLTLKAAKAGAFAYGSWKGKI
jgi:trans-aconitate 2-methyltransferase